MSARQYRSFKKKADFSGASINISDGSKLVPSKEMIQENGKWISTGLDEYVVVLDLKDKNGAPGGTYPLTKEDGSVFKVKTRYRFKSHVDVPNIEAPGLRAEE